MDGGASIHTGRNPSVDLRPVFRAVDRCHQRIYIAIGLPNHGRAAVGPVGARKRRRRQRRRQPALRLRCRSIRISRGHGCRGRRLPIGLIKIAPPRKEVWRRCREVWRRCQEVWLRCRRIQNGRRRRILRIHPTRTRHNPAEDPPQASFHKKQTRLPSITNTKA